MIYIYRLFKIVLWALGVFVLLPCALILTNLANLIWFFDFNHMVGVGKEEWADYCRWDGEEYEWCSENMKYKTIKYYYAGPWDLLRDKKTFV